MSSQEQSSFRFCRWAKAACPIRRLLLSGFPLVLTTRYFGMPGGNLARGRKFPIAGRQFCGSDLTQPAARGGDNVGAVTEGKTSHSPAFRKLRFWVWVQEHTHPTDLQITLVWAGIIGFCGGLSSIAFRAATAGVHKLLTGSSEPGLVETFSALPSWRRIAVPAAGGLIAGLILYFGTRLRGRVTTSDYMEAVVLGDG